MAAQITIDNLENGQEIYLTYEVTGSATPVNPATSITHVAWQIDDQDLHDLEVSGATVSFDFSISAGDCPNPDTWYMLTIYVWDSDAEVSTECRTFKRVELSTGSDDEEMGG